ncbi:MAG: CHASE3 domain-containing protein, partial [Verrucomicrobia bacterium]|nr:CHASE3 domain-containing protein [Verrucomicrobiota bacterium]
MKVETKVGASFGLALLAVLLVGSLIYGNNRALLQHNAQVVHTYQVLDGIDGIFDAAQEVESGMRGFVLTGRPEFLEVYQQSIDGLTPRLQKLRAQVKDNPAQLVRLAVLERLMLRKIALSQERVKECQTEGTAAAVKHFDGQGKATMDELRRHVADMRDIELTLLAQRMEQSAGSARRVITAYGVLLGVAVLLLGIFYVQVRNDLNDRIRIGALLEANERRFRGVMESAPDAIVLTDEAGRITLANSAFAKLFAVRSAEAQGR